jgi:uncharacterized membrane protein YfcA
VDATKVKAFNWVGAVVIGCATFLVYVPAIRGGFIWDDPDYVVNNPVLRDASGLVTMWTNPRSLKQWYPLVHTTYWIEYQLWGLNPLGYHIVNVLLHIAVALLIWRVLVVLDVPGAAWAALIFALHPVHVESVAWITERKNVLSGVFNFASLLWYLRSHRTDSRKAYAISLGLFICALLSKSVTATLPAAILVIIWWERGGIRWRDVVPLAPMLVLGIGMGLFTLHLEVSHVGATGQRVAELDLSLAERVLVAGTAVWFYIWKLIVPFPLTFIYPRWEIDVRSWQWIAPVGVVCVTVVLALSRRQIGRAPLAAFLLFVGTLFPALGFVNVYPMRFSWVADHFQYLASSALIAFAAALIAHLAPRLRGAICGVAAIVLGILTFNQGHIYCDAETLWRATVARNPDSWMVHVNLGDARFARSRAEAQHHYLTAVRLAPDLWETNFPAGLALAGGNRADQEQAMRYFQRTVELNPEFSRGWYSIGQLHQMRGERDLAILNYQKAIAVRPDYTEAKQRLDLLLRSASTQAAN